MSDDLNQRVANLEESRVAELEARDERAKKSATKRAKEEATSAAADDVRGVGHVQYLDDPQHIRSYVQAVNDGTVDDWERENPDAVAAMQAAESQRAVT
jgi:hypothetical protein